MERIAYPPAGVFRGRNFMTPDVLAFYHGKFRGRYVYVELSSGDFLGTLYFGVTVRPLAHAKALDPDPSKVFNSRSDAEQYIDNGLEENKS